MLCVPAVWGLVHQLWPPEAWCRMTSRKSQSSFTEVIHKNICALTCCGWYVLKMWWSSSYYLPFLCRYHADSGGTGKPWSQGSSERIHSSIEAGREVPAASSRNQNRGGSLCKSIPNARLGWIVKGPSEGFGTGGCVIKWAFTMTSLLDRWSLSSFYVKGFYWVWFSTTDLVTTICSDQVWNV